MKIWTTGEPVRITYGGKTVEGRVILASPNGRSLMLAFDGMLDGFVGAMPVLLDDDGRFMALFVDAPVTLSEVEVDLS